MSEEKKSAPQPSYRIESVFESVMERSIASKPLLVGTSMDAIEEMVRRLIGEELDKRGIGDTKK